MVWRKAGVGGREREVRGGRTGPRASPAGLVQGYQQLATEQLIGRQAGTITFDAVLRSNATFTDAFERILGIPHGSVTLADEPTLRLWFG